MRVRFWFTASFIIIVHATVKTNLGKWVEEGKGGQMDRDQVYSWGWKHGRRGSPEMSGASVISSVTAVSTPSGKQ